MSHPAARAALPPSPDQLALLRVAQAQRHRLDLLARELESTRRELARLRTLVFSALDWMAATDGETDCSRQPLVGGAATS